jgi:3',5'-cyclic AMP phosphodiesterase CpdA
MANGFLLCLGVLTAMNSGGWMLQTEQVEVPASFEDCWSLVILPDVQYYNETFPGLFELQTQWIRSHADTLRIQYVLLPGDITNTNSDKNWENASCALGLLDGRVPYAMCTGNHDCGPGGNAADRTTGLDRTFPYERLAGWSGLAGVKTAGQMANSYHLFEAPDLSRWLILTLEWAPTDSTLQWASEILAKYPDRKAILVVHAYLYYDDSRYDWKAKGKKQEWNPHDYPTQPAGNDGQEIWDKLIRRHNNVFLVVSGHVIGDGTGLLISRTDGGNSVIQMLVNYQSPIQDIGGRAWLRVLTFSKDLKKITCWSYSPLLKQMRSEPDQLFELRQVE